MTSGSTSETRAAGFANGASIITRWSASKGKWILESLPNHGSGLGIRAIDTDGTHFWAIGDGANGPIALHLVGGHWLLKKIPHALSGTDLRDLSVVSDTDVWAVGDVAGGVAASAMHWNGSSWQSKPPPVPTGATGVQLNTVERVPGMTEVMAVGYYVSSSHFFPYAVEWTGTAWKIEPTSTTPQGEFWGLVIRSGKNAWAVGETDPTQSNTKSLIDHWNGTGWKRVNSPNRTGGNQLLSVDARTSTDIWAVGYSYHCGQTTCSKYRTLALHYNGSSWTVGATANPSTTGLDILTSVTFVPGTKTFWAVGTEGPGRPALTAEFTLTERCC